LRWIGQGTPPYAQPVRGRGRVPVGLVGTIPWAAAMLGWRGGQGWRAKIGGVGAVWLRSLGPQLLMIILKVVWFWPGPWWPVVDVLRILRVVCFWPGPQWPVVVVLCILRVVCCWPGPRWPVVDVVWARGAAGGGTAWLGGKDWLVWRARRARQQGSKAWLGGKASMRHGWTGARVWRGRRCGGQSHSDSETIHFPLLS
jgi:hypothetical protein